MFYKENGKFKIICDICGERSEFGNIIEAIDYMDTAGYQGENNFICSECKEKEVD